MVYITAYMSALIAFLAIDYVWLAFIARDFYRGHLGEMMLESPKLGIAAVFYLVYVVVVVIFAVLPAMEKQQWITAALYGGLLGLVAYGTYDITNLATLKNWPATVSIVDLIWGTALTASIATISYLVTSTLHG